jgi:TolA-binding protein
VPAPSPSVTQTPLAEQKLYEKAIAEYRSNQFGLAQQSFASFLDRYPSSPFAPDAALYKAECLLKQAEEQQ